LSLIDDDIDNVLGLAVFYQHVRTAALNDRQYPTQNATVFTTNFFACYLCIQHLFVIKCDQFRQALSTDEYKRYGICVSNTQQLFIGDVLLFLSASRVLQCDHKVIWSNAATYTEEDK